MRHGSGRMMLSDGTVYEGQWQDDKQHGTGEPNQVVFGEWLA
jgi:hypothetical protein